MAAVNVVISGYYGFGNAGDELILRSMIREFRALRADMRITVLSADPADTARMCGVRAAARWNPFVVIRALRSCDVLVSGGGGLFQDNTGNLSLYYYLFLIFIARLLEKKTILYSVGVNDLRKMNGKLAGRIINAADAITVRDRESARLLAGWGVAEERISITADPVLLCGDLEKSGSSAAPVIAFILRAPVRREERATAAVARVVGMVKELLGAKIVFIPFQKCRDLSFTRSVAKLTSDEPSITEWDDPDEVLKAIGNVDLVVSQRFHGLVLAVLAGIPAVGVSGDRKVQRFMEEIGGQCFPGFDTAEDIARCILDSWNQRDRIRRDMIKMRQQLAKKAGETIEIIERVFSA